MGNNLSNFIVSAKLYLVSAYIRNAISARPGSRIFRHPADGDAGGRVSAPPTYSAENLGVLPAHGEEFWSRCPAVTGTAYKTWHGKVFEKRRRGELPGEFRIVIT
jgi:hypothetical protein